MDRISKYTYALLIGLAIASWWLLTLTGVDENRQPVPVHSTDVFSTHYVKLEMNAAGTPKSQLVADKMQHYKDNGVTELQQPRLSFTNTTTPPWLISAEKGVLSADGKDLYLEGQVFIERAKSQNSKALKIITTNLNVKPDINFAETTQRAELLSPPNITVGKGMKLVFEQPIRLELLANVQGKYEKK